MGEFGELENAKCEWTERGQPCPKTGTVQVLEPNPVHLGGLEHWFCPDHAPRAIEKFYKKKGR
jgi:hypothetical protein